MNEPILDGDFALWLRTLTNPQIAAILKIASLLTEFGPGLGRPYVGKIEGSEFSNMKELVVQIAGEPWRVLFAFDPNRTPVLLVGGNKTGDDRWYKTQIPIADARYRRHLERLKSRS
jgi:hypothetical protein